MPDRYFAPAWTTLPLAARRCRVRNPVNGVVAELDANRHAVLVDAVREPPLSNRLEAEDRVGLPRLWQPHRGKVRHLAEIMHLSGNDLDRVSRSGGGVVVQREKGGPVRGGFFQSHNHVAPHVILLTSIGPAGSHP